MQKNVKKMAKIGTLSLVSRLTRVLIKQNVNVCHKKSIRPCYHINFMKNIDNSITHDIKSSKIADICLPSVEQRLHDNYLGPLELGNILKKLANRILIARYKNHKHLICRYFSLKNLTTRRCKHPQ